MIFKRFITTARRRKMKVTKSIFGKAVNDTVSSYTLSNSRMSVKIIEYGARVAELLYDDVSVVCGFDTIEGYLKDNDYHGSIVGRYANRIYKGKFSIDGREYNVSNNEAGRYHLHGGYCGFSGKLWKLENLGCDDDRAYVTLKYVSPDNEEGFPGTLAVYVTYTLTLADELKIDYVAVSDKDTIINLTNHSYFNLSGVGNTILDHMLTMYCDQYIPVDQKLIPFGYFANVTGTPFDFRTAKAIGRDIDADDIQIKTAGGYDHCFTRDRGENKDSPLLIATISSPVTDITMDILTTEGGIQMYTGNFMTADNPFFSNCPQRKNQAVALECNRIPDSPNHAAFPSCVYRAGEKYTQTTIYRFKR